MLSGWVVPFARVPLWAGLFAKVVFLEIFGQETQGSRADLRKGKNPQKRRLKYWSVHMNLSKPDELRVQSQQFD